MRRSSETAAAREGAVSRVVLRGRLVCRNAEEVAVVLRHLPRHVELSRAEPGCLEFHVRRTSDPLVLEVAERFRDAAAFEAHQARVAASEWGRSTAGIERRYVVEGLTDRSGLLGAVGRGVRAWRRPRR